MSPLLKELSDRLLAALDSEHNVIDRETVYQIIAQLPTVYVNKELLETTRIARIVNVLRKKTPEVELAKKCKNLLKVWREAVLPNQPNTQTVPLMPKAPKVEPINQNGTISSVPDGAAVAAAAAYHHNFNHHSNHSSSSRISPGMGPTMVRGGSYSNNNNNKNNNLRIPVLPTRSQPPMEIIDLVDERSNSPQLMFPRKASGKRSHSPSPARMDAAAAAASRTTGSANRWTTSGHHSSSLPSFRMESSNTSTCDNENFVDNDSNVSRKHKKHKKDKRSKQQQLLTAYNHVDERSAPSILLEDSLSRGVVGMHGQSLPMNNSHLILPDNDSLSNTSASIFATSAAAAAAAVPTTPLNFAGHFSRSDPPFEPPYPISSRVPTVGLESRSASPHIFTTNNSSEPPFHDAVGAAAVVPDPVLLPEKPAVKVQKKRGRKKGSKGIDSLLASQNEGAMTTLWHPDSYQDLKQKITSISGPKKNKTAMELLAEIQNKRSGSGNVSAVTSPSVTQAPSPSSLSDKSHQSQSTEIGSISAAVSPEPPSKVSKEVVASTSKDDKPEDIELQIARLLAQLPPIYKTDDDDDDGDDLPKCTCTFREVTEEEENPTAATTDGSVNNIEINIVRDSDEEMAAVQARARLKAKKRKKREKVAVKSIFDLDDDNDVVSGGGGGNDDNTSSFDDESDLESVPDKTEVLDVLVANEFPAPQPTPTAIFPFGADDEPPMEPPKFTKYEAVIDPDCPAMEHFETNRNDVTRFHVQALHGSYVPFVNGNWSQPIVNPLPAPADDVSVDTANRVVPRYNFLMCDKIPKTFPEKYAEADDDDDDDDHNNGKLPTFNELNGDNVTGQSTEHEDANGEFREWYQTVRVQVPFNDTTDENLTILPYVVID